VVCGEADALVGARADGVQRVAVAGIHVADHRDFDRVDHLLQPVGDLLRRDQAMSGMPVERGDAAAGGVDQLRAAVLDDAARQAS
jgi:hypothetical protein